MYFLASGLSQKGTQVVDSVFAPIPARSARTWEWWHFSLTFYSFVSKCWQSSLSTSSRSKQSRAFDSHARAAGDNDFKRQRDTTPIMIFTSELASCPSDTIRYFTLTHEHFSWYNRTQEYRVKLNGIQCNTSVIPEHSWHQIVFSVMQAHHVTPKSIQCNARACFDTKSYPV